MELKSENRYEIVGLLSLLAFFSLLWGAASASVNPKLVLDNYTISESPALPGHEVVLKLHLTNIDPDTCANRVSVQAATSYPLSVDGSDVQYRGSICPGDTVNGTVRFKIPVDSLAQTGTYPISVMTTYEKDLNKFSESNTISLRVGGSPSFSASVSSSNPVDVYPGDAAAITIKFQNNGASQADSVHVTLAAPQGIEVKWAGSAQELGSIPARGSASATFQIEAAKNIAPGKYALNATLEYLGEDKGPGTQSFLLDMPLKGKAEFGADAQKGGQFAAGDDKEITITLTNTGSEKAEKLKVRIMPVFPFSTDGTVRYIDSLNPGETKNLIYVIHVDKDATAGEQTAGLLIDFENPQGDKFTDSIDLALSLRAKNLGYYLEAYWWAIALIAAVIFAIKRRSAILQKILKKSDK